MSPHRLSQASRVSAPPAPCWRLARAWVTGSLRLLPWARASRAAESDRRRGRNVLAHGWIPRGFALAMKGWDVEAIDFGYPDAPPAAIAPPR